MNGTKATAPVIGAHGLDFIWNTITCSEGHAAVSPHTPEHRA